mgnify:CR=1 FL=1
MRLYLKLFTIPLLYEIDVEEKGGQQLLYSIFDYYRFIFLREGGKNYSTSGF